MKSKGLPHSLKSIPFSAISSSSFLFISCKLLLAMRIGKGDWCKLLAPLTEFTFVSSQAFNLASFVFACEVVSKKRKTVLPCMKHAGLKLYLDKLSFPVSKQFLDGDGGRAKEKSLLGWVWNEGRYPLSRRSFIPDYVNKKFDKFAIISLDVNVQYPNF